jgi:glycosyltransferase involved in cell wall biosynthesis
VAGPRIIVLTRDPTGPTLGGNAIRATELARLLGPHGDVTLAAPGEAPEPAAPFKHVVWDAERPAQLRSILSGADVVVTTPQSPTIAAELRRSGARLVLDLYDPYPLAVLEAYRGAPPLRRRLQATLTLDTFTEALRMAHHVICASERQRDLWLGLMLGTGLMRPENYDADPTLRGRIDVVPTGVSTAPIPGGRPLRERLPKIGEEDEIVLWYGGLWDWVDPVTAVRAFAALLPGRPRAKLVFLGRSPSAADQGAMAARARALAGELGLAERSVFFLEAMVPYGERGAWLREADCAISTHREHLETRFAYRTRILDFIWARLPVVCTSGDELADLVARDGIGAAVPPGDAEGAAAALDRVLERGRDAYAPAFDQAAAELAWPRVGEPLVRFATAAETPPRLGDAARLPALPGAPARALAIRALRASQGLFNR